MNERIQAMKNVLMWSKNAWWEHASKNYLDPIADKPSAFTIVEQMIKEAEKADANPHLLKLAIYKRISMYCSHIGQPVDGLYECPDCEKLAQVAMEGVLE